MTDDARNERIAEAHGAVRAATESLERALETLEREGEDGCILLQLDLAIAHLNDAAACVRIMGRENARLRAELDEIEQHDIERSERD